MSLRRERSLENSTTFQLIRDETSIYFSFCSEVASPPQVIPLLLSPSFTSLPSSSSTKSNSTSTSKVTPSPLVLCSLLHNSAKLFAYWAAKAGEEEEVWEHASEGNEGHSKNLIIKRREIIEEVRDVAKVLDGGCERLERSEEAEVQERVSLNNFLFSLSCNIPDQTLFMSDFLRLRLLNSDNF